MVGMNKYIEDKKGFMFPNYNRFKILQDSDTSEYSWNVRWKITENENSFEVFLKIQTLFS